MALHLEDVQLVCRGGIGIVVVHESHSSGRRRAGGDTGCGWVWVGVVANPQVS